MTETPFTFECGGESLLGILHLPQATPRCGVVIVVGGPQYRAGSHRQFLLLARALAGRGIAVLRFDCRGMGDSDGTFRGFECIEPDIAAAVDALAAKVAPLRDIVLWGLCDATTGICRVAQDDRRVTGVVLLNPWVRSEATLARTQLRHYYFQRLAEPGFWRKLVRLKFDPIAAGRGFIGAIVRARRAEAGVTNGGAANPLAEGMAASLARFRGPILLITSGRDLTGQEFEGAANGSPAWQRLIAAGRVTRQRLVDADHTFSRAAWRAQVERWTIEWIEAFSER